MKRYSIFQKHKAVGNTTWYGRIAEDGLFRVVSLGTKKKADAVAWLDLMNAKKFLPDTGEKPNVGIVELANKFIDYTETSSGSSTATVLAYRQRLSKFTRWATGRGKNTVNDLTELDAVEFSNEISARHSPKTANEVIKLTKAMFEFSRRIYRTEGNPFEFVRRPKLKRTAKGFWTPDEIDAILAAAPNADYRRFWALMAFAGLRYFEARDLRWKDLESDRLRIMGKGGKLATVPVSDRLKMELGTPGGDDDRVIPEGTFATNTSSIRELREAVTRAGISPEGANNHRFRHSFASNLIRSGVNIKAVQQLMRHESIDITLNTYSHLLPDDLHAAVNAI